MPKKLDTNFTSRPTKIEPILAVLEGWGQLLQKVAIFTPNRHVCCVNPRCLSHFASKAVEGCDLQIGWGKIKKVTETPIGKTCRR